MPNFLKRKLEEENLSYKKWFFFKFIHVRRFGLVQECLIVIRVGVFFVEPVNVLEASDVLFGRRFFVAFWGAIIVGTTTAAA